MRAAQVQGGKVVNFVEVTSFDGVEFVDPLDSVRGSTWDGQVFVNPPSHPTRAEYLAAIDSILAEGAARRLYDSIHTAALRAGYPGPFHDEGVLYATWMDSVYATCYQVQGQVARGERPIPSIAEFLELMPPCPVSADSGGA